MEIWVNYPCAIWSLPYTQGCCGEVMARLQPFILVSLKIWHLWKSIGWKNASICQMTESVLFEPLFESLGPLFEEVRKETANVGK